MSKGLSQRRLGVLVGMDESSASPRVNQYETDKYLPDFRVAERLAACVDVPVAYLYAEDDLLAKLILGFGRLSPRQRTKAVEALAEIAAR